MDMEAQPDVLDPVTVERLRGLQAAIDTEDVIAELTAIFTRDSARYLESVRAEIATGAREKAADGLHALKGASLSVGASEVSRICVRLEDEVREAADTDHTQDLDSLGEAIDRAITALRGLARADGATASG